MAKEKSTKLLEKFRNKVKKTRALHEFEWGGLKLQCPYRKRRKADNSTWEHGCRRCNESSANTKNFFYYCHFSNCPYT